ncbi:hypothetical protein OF83DRAFT_1032858, partial [Amylostereum chailletii]
MYHDKRFQTDPMFPLVAFNHEKIKDSTTAGYLMTRRANFQDISRRLGNIDRHVLDSLIHRLGSGEHVRPESDAEQQCYQLIQDLDLVAFKVDGSRTSKKNMRNEIWALTSYYGAPSWFVTFAPADVNHPIALYYAADGHTVFPTFYERDERVRLIAKNPVAGARFFKVMVDMFIKYVL